MYKKADINEQYFTPFRTKHYWPWSEGSRVGEEQAFLFSADDEAAALLLDLSDGDIKVQVEISVLYYCMCCSPDEKIEADGSLRRWLCLLRQEP